MKDTVKRVRRQSTDWEKILTKHTPDKGLLLKIYKDILIFNNVENNQILKTGINPKQRLHQEDIQMVNKHMTRSLYHTSLRKCKLKQ